MDQTKLKLLRSRLARLFGVPAELIVVTWDAASHKPCVRLPCRVGMVGIDLKRTAASVVDEFVREELRYARDTIELTDEELTARLRLERAYK